MEWIEPKHCNMEQKQGTILAIKGRDVLTLGVSQYLYRYSTCEHCNVGYHLTGRHCCHPPVL